MTLHGTGIHPGGITELFPLVISALSGSITSVRAEEFSDIRTYGAPDVVRDWMLFGKTPEEARTSIMADALGAGLPPVGADGGRRARLRPRPRAAHDARDGGGHGPHRLPIGPIEPGTVAAQRFRWEAMVDGEAVVTAAVNWLMGTETSTRPGRSVPAGERFEVEITGDPECPRHVQGAAPALDRRGD